MPMVENAHKAANILGFQLYSKDKLDLLKNIEVYISRNKKPLLIFTPNAEQLVQTQQNPNFSRYLKQADLLIPDGMSLVWSSRLLSLKGGVEPIAERIAGIDLVKDLLKFAQREKLNCLVVGGAGYERVVVAAVPLQNNCWQIAPNLFWTPGYADVSNPQPEENELIESCLSQLKPAVVFAAFGAPKQEQWIIENRDFLEKQQVKLAMSVGGAFDVILGKLQRAPQWMRNLGLEWSFRLLQEPWRWRRQTRLVVFAGLIFKQFFSRND